MDVGAAIELPLGQETVTVTISGLFDASKAANGQGALAFWKPAGPFLADLPVRRCQSDQYDAFQPDFPEAGEQYPALGWPDREAAVPDEYHRGNVPVVLSVWMVRRQKKQFLVEQMRAQG